MTIKDIMDKVNTLFSKSFSAEELNELRQYVQLADMPPVEAAPTEPAPVEAKEFKGADGTLFYSKSDLAVGSDLFTDKEMTTPVADSKITMEDGSIVTVMGGKVAEIATAQEEKTDMPAEMAKMNSQLSAHKTELEVKFSEQSKQIEDLKKQVVLLTSHLTKILSTPVNTVEEKKVDLSKMSAFEKRNYYKSLQNG